MFRLTVILLVVGAFVLAPVVGNAQSDAHKKKIERYTKEISINPNNPDFYNNRGVANNDLHRYNEGFNDFGYVAKTDLKEGVKNERV